MPQRGYTPEEAVLAREEKLAEFGQKIERAVEELVTGTDWINAIAFAARFRSRSFLNTIAIYVQHQEAHGRGLVPEPLPSYVAGFKQWQQFGRSVAKGQPGYMILAPVTAAFASTDPASGEWRRLEKHERPRTGESVTTRMVGVRPAYVWDVTQTTGEGAVPIRPMPKLLEGEAPVGLWDALADRIVADLGYTLSEVSDAAEIRGANGMTDYLLRRVSVRTDMDEAARVKTLAHELGHILLTDPANPDASHHRGISEVEAESFAAMLAACYGMDTTQYTVPYVAGWSETVKDKTPLEVLQATGERVRRAVLAELEHLPEPAIGDGSLPDLDVPERQTAELPAARRAYVGQEADMVEPVRAAVGL